MKGKWINTLNSRRVRGILLLCLLKIANLADNHHPISHILLRVGGHVISPIRRFHVEHMLKLNALAIKSQASINLFDLV